MKSLDADSSLSGDAEANINCSLCEDLIVPDRYITDDEYLAYDDVLLRIIVLRLPDWWHNITLKLLN